MGDGNDRALILSQVCLKPLDTLGVQMVGGLVEQQHVGLAQQQAAQGHAAALTSAEVGYLSLGGRALQGVHRPFELGVKLPSVAMLYFLSDLALSLDESVHLLVRHGLGEFHIYLLIFFQQISDLLYSLLDHFDDCLVRVHLRLLLQVSDRIAGGPYDLSLIGFLHSCDNFHQSGFS